MSATGFKYICLAVDRMLIWTIQPSAADCAELEMGDRLFRCFRTDKFGMVLMAGCDHLCRFHGLILDIWALPLITFATSELGLKLEKEDNNMLNSGNAIVGDNAWVETN